MKFFSGVRLRLRGQPTTQRKEAPPPGAGRLTPRAWKVRHGRPAEKPAPEGQPLSRSLAGNVERLKEMMGRDNADVIIRRFIIGTKPSIQAALFFIEGLADRTTHIEGIIKPLMVQSTREVGMAAPDPRELAEVIQSQLMPTAEALTVTTLEEVVDHAMTGESALLIDGATEAVIIETRGWKSRGVEAPETEISIRGPRESFTEVLRFNTALIRRRIRDPRLRLDGMRVGRMSRTDVVVGYIHGLTDPDLITTVKERIKAIETDFIPDSSYIEQFIEDRPFSPFPQVQYSERTDRATAALAEGRLIIIVDGSPMVLIIPSTFTTLIQAPEDYYERPILGTFFRIIRSLSAFISLTLPAFYVAITSFHQEMLPTELILAFAAARERVPFPAIVELLVMEVSLELVREAGLRLPSPAGQTVGIVGALLLGQAAVQAQIVSPIIVIVVALTALASFAVPHYSTGIAIRVLRFLLLILGATLGLFGVTAGMTAITIHMASLTSLGTPYLTPLAPLRPRSALLDTVLRAPLWRQDLRPGWLHPRDDRRQARITRPWSSTAPDAAGGGGKTGGRKGGKKERRRS
ncbi:MAG: spore germination protein [Chloroflexota bacterium]